MVLLEGIDVRAAALGPELPETILLLLSSRMRGAAPMHRLLPLYLRLCSPLSWILAAGFLTVCW
jgi:hypothetical protein